MKGPYLVKYSLQPGWYHESASKSGQHSGKLGVFRNASEGMAEGRHTLAHLIRGEMSDLRISLSFSEPHRWPYHGLEAGDALVPGQNYAHTCHLSGFVQSWIRTVSDQL